MLQVSCLLILYTNKFQFVLPFICRNRSSKSASEGSVDSDSIGSAQDSTTSSSQLPAQGSIDEGEVMPASLDYDTVLVISLNVSSPPECPGLMSEEKVLSTLQVIVEGYTLQQ